MAMLEKHRNVLYKHFVDEIGEEATQAMLAHFPARDVEEPVTRADLATATAALRSDLATATANLRSDLATTTADLRSDLATTAADLRSDLATTAADLRSDLATTTADLQSEIHEVSLGLEALRTEMHRLLNRQIVALTTVIGIAVGVILGAG